MDFAREVMISESLIEGRNNPHGLGWLDVNRLEEVMNELHSIGFLKTQMNVGDFTDLSYLESL